MTRAAAAEQLGWSEESLKTYRARYRSRGFPQSWDDVEAIRAWLSRRWPRGRPSKRPAADRGA